MKINTRVTRTGVLWSILEMVKWLKTGGIINIVRMISSAEDVYIDPDSYSNEKGEEDQLTSAAWLQVSETLAAMARMARVFGKNDLRNALTDYAESNNPMKQDAFYVALKFFTDAFEDTRLLLLDSGMQDHYEQEEYFGDEALNAFPSAYHDVRDCGSCFALGQYTASVYHALRALETPLQLIANNFGVIKFESWGKALNEVEALVRNRENPQKIPNWSEVADFYTDAINHLFAVKNAWRNYTMHNKSRFDEKEAEEIIMSVRAFMRKAAKVVKET